MLKKQEKRYRRHRRVRTKIFGTAKIPRLCIFRSLKHIYAQLINDENGQTILSSSEIEFRNLKVKSKILKTKIKKPSSVKAIADKEKKVRTRKVATAYEIGKLIAQKALKKKIKQVVFDRGGYNYHGRVKALAEGARDEGLKF